MRIHPMLLVGAVGCGTPARVPQPFVAPYPPDSARTEQVASGVTYRYLHTPGPWAIHVLDVDLTRCYRAKALKGTSGAVGRERTSVLLQSLAERAQVLAGVNADFFLFAPPGVPQGLLVTEGRVISGPAQPARPALLFDGKGRARIGVVGASGAVTLRGVRYAISGWNRPAADGIAVFDAGYGPALDTASAVVEVQLAGRSRSSVLAVDTLRAGVGIPASGWVVVAGPRAPAGWRAALASLQPGERAAVRVALTPWHPREAVGGRPILIADSSVAQVEQADGAAGFAMARHPRTAVGLGRGGNRLLLVAVDGRQVPYSDGMTLRELAELLLALGARDAINLDGGGSTTLLYADPARGGALTIANRPSDKEGERPVGDALAIVQACATP